MTTLDQIVRSVLNAEGSQGLHGYDRYLIFAYECLDDLKISVLSTVRTAIQPIDEVTMSVALPGDCIKLLKASIWTGQPGRGTFRRLRQAPRTDVKISGGITKYVQASADLGVMEPFLNYHNPVTNLYSAVYAQYGQDLESGTYDYDTTRQLVTLDTQFGTTYPFLVSMYKSKGDKSAQLVPDDSFMAIRAYIQWQKIWDKPSYTNQEKMMRRNEYYNQRRVLRNRRFGLTVEEFNEARRLSYTAGVKLPDSHAD